MLTFPIYYGKINFKFEKATTVILIDFNQVVIANMMVQIGGHYNVEIEENLVRHMILNSLRSYRQKFSSEYGELVICCDDKNYWRRSLYPYYKASRKKDREKSELDWNEIFRILNKVRDELKDNFPYKVIRVETAEADDIIGTICHTYGMAIGGESILILSADKDYIQLHKYANVNQYDPIRKRWIKHDNPEKYLKEHIIRGDSGDGVPNILSDDDTFVLSKRQKPLTQKKLESFLSNGITDSEALRGFTRNEALIDLSKIPEDIKDSVLNKYNEPDEVGRSKLFNYFIANRLRNLMENINEF